MAAGGARPGGPADRGAEPPALTSWLAAGCLLSCSSSCFCRTWSWVRASARSAWNLAISWECFPSWVLAHERGGELRRWADASPALPPEMVSGHRHLSWVRLETTDLTHCSLNEPRDPLGDAHVTDYGGSDNPTGTNSVPEHVQLEDAQSGPTVTPGSGHGPRDECL